MALAQIKPEGTPRLTVLSGVGRKYPACFEVQVAGRRFLFDLGAGAGTAPDRPDLSKATGPVDAVLLSHQHPDHLGGLDLLNDLGAPPVFASDPVASAVRARFGLECRPLPLGGEAEVLGVPLRLGRSGHAPGGLWFHMEDGGESLLYMGDHVDHSPLYPFDPPPRADLVILDASYGTESVSQAMRAQAVMDALAREPMLLPVPLAGRGLEIALGMVERGMPLPALCPDLRAMARRLVDWETGEWPGVIRVEAVPLLERLANEAPEADQPDRVTLVSGAVLETPFSLKLAARWAGQGAPVLFTGHIPSRTPALAMVESGRASWMRWNVHPTLQENVALARAVKADRVLPAFCDPDHWTLYAATLPGLEIG